MSESIIFAFSLVLITQTYKKLAIPTAAPYNTSRQVVIENSDTGKRDSGLTWILQITAILNLGKCSIS